MLKKVETETVTVAGVELITVRDPEVLRKYGWKAPFPSYVSAAPVLWQKWLERVRHGKK